jgi:hypothetical protein
VGTNGLSGYYRVDGFGSKMVLSRPGGGQVTEVANGEISRTIAKELKAAGAEVTGLKQFDKLIKGMSEVALEVMPQPDWDKGWGRPKKAPAATKRAFKAAVAQMETSLKTLVAETLPAGWVLKENGTDSKLNYHDQTRVTHRLEHRTKGSYQDVQLTFGLGHRPTEEGRKQRREDQADIYLSSRVGLGNSGVYSSINQNIDLENGARVKEDVSELLSFSPNANLVN